MTSIAREHLTRNKKHCNNGQTTCTFLRWCYWICMQREYNSVVEHSSAVREVPGSNPGVPLYNFWKTRKKMTLIARVHLTRNKKHCNSARTTWVCLQWCYWISMQRGYSSVVEHSAAIREVPGSNLVVPCIIFERLEKKGIGRERTLDSEQKTW